MSKTICHHHGDMWMPGCYHCELICIQMFHVDVASYLATVDKPGMVTLATSCPTCGDSHSSQEPLEGLVSKMALDELKRR